VLVVGQLALSFVLLAAAGLMIRSLVRLQNVDPGFDPVNVLTATVDLDWSEYAQGHDTDPQAMVDFYRPLLERLASEPGVVAAGVGASFPLSESTPFNAGFRVEGKPAADGAGPVADFQVASAGWFDAVGVPLLSGRMFRATDEPGPPYHVLVSRSLARRHWGNDDPVGRRISTDGGETWDTVIGVVGDVRARGLDQEPAETIYYSYLQNPLLSTSLVLRTTGDPRRLAARVREEVRRIDPEQPVAQVRTLEEVRSGSLAPPRLTALLLGLFAALALVIAAAGIGGVLAFAVTQRTHEIGIRVALGARPAAVVAMVVGQVAVMVAAGLGLGLAGAFAVGRLMSGLLYEVRPTDPGTLVLVSLVLAAVALAACLGPARRATAIPPLLALRAE
jgi:putative ABC transport system permease protein